MHVNKKGLDFYLRKIFRRNYVTLNMDKAKKSRVNLEWVDNGNVGDSLGLVICDWMLARKDFNIDTSIRMKTVHFITCGLLVGAGSFDSVVRGSGIHVFANIKSFLFKRYVRKYDVKAVRGPITRRILIDCGYDCKSVYGDPAVLINTGGDVSEGVNELDGEIGKTIVFRFRSTRLGVAA